MITAWLPKFNVMISSQITATPKLFIGMDVHKKSWTCHFKTDLFDYKTVTMPANPNCLKDYVIKNFPGHEVSCCYEAGCCGYWIARKLQQLNWNVLVVNPADIENKLTCQTYKPLKSLY